MKTKLIFLVMLIACISCGRNNKPVSDTQKEKIKGEVKEVVNTIVKNGEEANFDNISGLLHNSPDFVSLFNGNPFTYQQFIDMGKSMYNTLLNQEGTILDEKYMVLDNSTVLFTANTKWLVNFKDGHSVMQDPWAMQYVFKKVDNDWKIISFNESGVEKNVASESSKGLNQAELLMQYVGNFEQPSGKDTTEFVQFKSLQGQNVLSLYAKVVTKGKILLEETGFWGYDAANNNIDLSVIVSNGYVFHYTGEFTSSNRLELRDVNATGNQFIFERISSDEFKLISIVNNITTTRISKRVK